MRELDPRGGHYAARLQDAEIYRERRRRLAEAVGSGTVLVRGAGDDRGYGDVGTFRQTSTFFYLTGVELPNAVVVLRPGDDTDALFLPPRNPNVEVWTGPKFGPGEDAAEVLGFGEVLSTTPTEVVLDARRRPVPGLEGRLQGWLSEPGAVLWASLSPVSTDAELTPDLRFVARLRERLPSFETRDVTGLVDELRMRKDDGEIELMRTAAAATIAGQRAAARAIAPGVREGQVEGAVYAAFRHEGAEGLAFPSIVGSGFNATTLHYDQNAGVCRDGELVVVDVGARYGYYCGDLTRTYPASRSFTERQRGLYELVLEAHDRVAEAIRPGVTIFELRKVAYGVFQDSPLRDRNGERLGRYFLHGLGHFLGLDAHDPGGDHVKLEPGMVITNEPGLYLPDEELGIRLEDDHVVTTSGNDNLSAALPIRADEVLELMGSV